MVQVLAIIVVLAVAVVAVILLSKHTMQVARLVAANWVWTGSSQLIDEKVSILCSRLDLARSHLGKEYNKRSGPDL